jgi:uncharacterized membrane protein YfhO
VKVRESRPGRWCLQTRAERDGWVVLTETGSSGWRAKIDGASVEIASYLGEFMAVAVPSGEHLVEWDYRPRHFAILLAVSGAGLLLLVAGCLWMSPSDRSRSPEPSS